MPLNVMLDIETLSTRPDAVVHQLGFVAFDNDIRGTSFVCPDIRMQTDRHICPDTLLWTLKHGVFKPDLMIPEKPLVVAFFDGLCQATGTLNNLDVVWWSFHRFDFDIMRNALGHKAPFNHRMRDAYTLFQACGYRMQENIHNGLEDALNHARDVIECNKRLEVL